FICWRSPIAAIIVWIAIAEPIGYWGLEAGRGKHDLCSPRRHPNLSRQLMLGDPDSSPAARAINETAITKTSGGPMKSCSDTEHARMSQCLGSLVKVVIAGAYKILNILIGVLPATDSRGDSLACRRRQVFRRSHEHHNHRCRTCRRCHGAARANYPLRFKCGARGGLSV